MSREQLKALVKECLVELLSEGLGTTIKKTLPEQRTNFSGMHQVQRNLGQTKKQFDPKLDTKINSNANIVEAVKKSANGNSVMELIFADTAATTLQQQTAHGDMSSPISEGARPAPVEKINGTPESIFGQEVATKWADLAFTTKMSKIS